MYLNGCMACHINLFVFNALTFMFCSVSWVLGHREFGIDEEILKGNSRPGKNVPMVRRLGDTK